MKTSYIIILFLIMQWNYMAVECLLRTSMMTASGNETDHAALLAIKAGLVGGSSESVEALNSWNASLYFCKWEGVTCDGYHERVTALDLGGRNTGGFVSPFIGNLSFLRILNLSGNRLEGFIPKEIGLLSRLEIFDVSNNALQGGFPLHLTNCTRLLTLVLARNGLGGILPHQLGSMSNLQILALRRNNFTGEIPGSLGNISSFIQLGLGENRLQGSIPSNLGKLKSLTFLALGQNYLSGKMPSSLYNLTNLRQLALAVNQFSGTLAPNLGLQFPHLRLAFFGANSFTGIIPPTLSNISALERFGANQNNFYGNIPEGLGRLEHLERFNVGRNNLGSENEGDLDFMTNLTSLRILRINGNRFGGMIPHSIGNLSSKIEELRLESNMISGRIPPGIGNLVSLVGLGIANNNLTGEIPSSIENLVRLQELALGRNRLRGTIPSSLGNLKNLYNLALEKNEFEGSLPPNLQNCSSLQKLYLNGNKLNGTVSMELVQNLWLGSNMISGHIPFEIGNLISLVGLGMENNILTGEIPSSIGNLVELQLLTLGGNGLQGTIPSSLGNLKILYFLGLEGNRLEGSIPLNLQNCSSLQTLSLCGNRLNGTVSMELIQSLNLHLQNNSFTGYFPAAVGELINLNVLDISHNKFSGEIPSELGKCSSLEFLQVQVNSFEGRIPSSLGSLRSARHMDLSSNNLSGVIPSELQDLRSLKFLNISFNHLEGKVPVKGVFSNFTGFFFKGNEKLCGGIPQLHLARCLSIDKINNERRRSMSTTVIVAVIVSIFFGFILVSIFTWMVCRKVPKRNNTPAISLMDGGQHLRLSYKQLWDATNGFSAGNIIGAGSFGSVYSGALGDKRVAVKVMSLEKHGAIKSFKAECKTLSKIRHRNLLQILSCCSSLDYKGEDFLALVYELMPNGSLESWLHGSRTLKLEQRLDVAMDIASALEYLHHDCESEIVHCDLKPSNVLLDDDMVAHVGDFGLAKILRGRLSDNLSHEQSISSLGVKGTVGYVPPEYGTGANVSTEGDMYSFGILLLEMVTGRRPTDEIFKDNASLHNMCKYEVMNTNMLHIVDPHLLAELNNDNENSNGTNSEGMDVEKMKECMKAITEVGLACSMESPNERMDIKEALKVLHRTKSEFIEKRIRAGRQNVHHFADEDHSMNVNV